MSLARFDYDGGALVFSRAPLRPDRSREVIQAETTSSGGVRGGLDPVADESLIPLRWRGMPTSEADVLEAFMLRTVGGMAASFTYTDVDGVAISVAFASPEMQRGEISAGREDVSIVLVEV